MQDGTYIIRSIDPVNGVQFDYQVWGVQRTHTVFLDSYSDPTVIQQACADYVKAEDTRLTPVNLPDTVPTDVISLLGQPFEAN